MGKLVYIAGPMRGIERYNYPAFDAAAAELRAAGWEVYSPADMDRNAGIDAMTMPADTDWDKFPPGFDVAACASRCLEGVLASGAIYLLPGWSKSQGARAEYSVACWTGKRVILPPGSEKDAGLNSPVLAEADALINGNRQASYGPPEQDFKRTADMWTGLLQYRMLPGERFKPEDVAWMMVCLKASRAQHQDKRDNYVDAAGYAACGWRCVEAAK